MFKVVWNTRDKFIQISFGNVSVLGIMSVSFV
jgi:hypothetical protein